MVTHEATITPTLLGDESRIFGRNLIALNWVLRKAVDSSFEHPEAARAELETAEVSGRPLGPRLALACVELSGGDLTNLRHWGEEARIDYREVCMAAWY